MSTKRTLLNVVTGNQVPYEENKNYGDEHGFSEGVELVIEYNSKNALYSIVDKEKNVLLMEC